MHPSSLRAATRLLPLAALALVLGLGPEVAAGASGPHLSVSPSSGLHSGQVVHLTGTGFPTHAGGKPVSYFVTECNGKVSGSLSLKDEPYCALSLAKAIKVRPGGTFSTTFTVKEGKVGNGTCGAGAHCVVGVGDIAGQGAVARITF